MSTIVLTGAGRGIGQATALRLAGLGHKVVLCARNGASVERAVAAIRTRVPHADLDPRVIDLSSMEQVRAAGRRLSDDGLVVDVLLHCAGVMQRSPVRRLTVDGFEETLAVNAFAPFLLTSVLMPALRRSPNARVLTVSSELEADGSRGASVDFDLEDPFLSRRYSPERAYKNSKRAVLWFTYELHRRLRLEHVTVNAMTPGLVPMTASSQSRGFERWFMRHVLTHAPFSSTVDQAAAWFVFMALSPSLEGLGGGFFAAGKRLASSAESNDERRALNFWALAQNATRSGFWPEPLPFPFTEDHHAEEEPVHSRDL